jgi:hypothetical protein
MSFFQWNFVFVVLLLVAPLSWSLTQRELDGVASLIEDWLQLSHTSPPWQSKNTSAVCDVPFYGVTCSDGPDPHIIGLYVLFTVATVSDRILSLFWILHAALSL